MTQRLAVVSGATGGIGGAIVARLLTEGYAVIACGRDEQKLQALADQHGSASLLTLYALDLLQRTPTLLSGTPVSLLVTAHGAAPLLKPSYAVSAAAFRKIYETDVLGTFLMAQAVYPLMRAQGGSMVFLSSLHARQSYPARAAYASSKAAVCGLMRTLALEWGPQGIRVNAILPWQVQGPRGDALAVQAAERGEDLVEAYKQRSPMRRLIQPEEVAEAVLFLARNKACNGMELVLDGGVSSSMWYKRFEEPTL